MQKYSKIVIENWSFWLLIVLSIVGIILDNLKLLPSSILTSFLLIVICTFTINQIFSNIRIRKMIEELQMGKGITKKVDIREFYSLLSYYVNHAKETIDGTYHQSTDPTAEELWERSSYFNTIDRIIKRKKIRVRRIVTINSLEKFDVVNKWISDYSDCPNLHLRYSPVQDDNVPPPLSLIVIDGRIALIAGITTGHHVLSKQNIDLVMEGEELGEVFQEYYDRYWDSINSIKEGKVVNEELLKKIELKLKMRANS